VRGRDLQPVDQRPAIPDPLTFLDGLVRAAAYWIGGRMIDVGYLLWSWGGRFRSGDVREADLG
jgi:hypothetical protein